MNHVIFNNVDLTTFGLYVSGDKTFDSPEKNYTKVSIPGRSGDLYISDGTYKNVKLKYDSILIEDFDNNAANLRNFLLSPEGYVVLEDDYHPNEYRMAVYSGPMSFKPVRLLAGTTTLEFNCMPQRWLKSGAASRQLNAESYIISNPTTNSAKPLFEIAPNDQNVTVTVKDSSDVTTSIFTISPRDYTVYVDCETMDCYSVPVSESTTPTGGTLTTGIWQDSSGYVHISPENNLGVNVSITEKTPRNNLITLGNYDFPVFKLGDTTIESSSYDLIKLTPRWFIL